MQKKTFKGVYKIYSRIGVSGIPDRLIARISIDKDFSILEDHEGIFDGSVPEGAMDPVHHKFLESLAASGYFRMVSEESLNQGTHDDMIEELDIHLQPDHEYFLYSQDGEQPKRLHIFEDSWVVDGAQLSEEEKQAYIEKIRTKELGLHPL
jgi:hypothetical protein